MQRLVQTSLVLFLAVAATSCVIVRSSSDVDRTGDYVSPQTFAQIEPGATPEYVLALLGSPTSKTELPDGSEIWKWRYTEVRESHGGILLVVNSRKSTDTVHNSYVELADGVVVRAWRD